MHLDEIISAQRKGVARGIVSVCSAHPAVLEAAFRWALERNTHLLIESTCNQVNQFGGYTGMTPADFAAFVEKARSLRSTEYAVLLKLRSLAEGSREDIVQFRQV